MALLQENRYDLVLLDEQMPGISGLEVLEIMRREDPHQRVVMVTKSEEDRTMTEAIHLRSRNAALMTDLAQTKARQVAEAETMMRTVLGCAPIALWAIDSDGTLTFMDGNRIGRDNGLTLPAVGENLFTVLTPILNGGETAAFYSFLFLYLAARGGGIFSVDGLRQLRREAGPKEIAATAKPGPALPPDDDFPELTEEDLAEDPEIAELLGDNP